MQKWLQSSSSVVDLSVHNLSFCNLFSGWNSRTSTQNQPKNKFQCTYRTNFKHLCKNGCSLRRAWSIIRFIFYRFATYFRGGIHILRRKINLRISFNVLIAQIYAKMVLQSSSSVVDISVHILSFCNLFSGWNSHTSTQNQSKNKFLCSYRLNFKYLYKNAFKVFFERRLNFALNILPFCNLFSRWNSVYIERELT